MSVVCVDENFAYAIESTPNRTLKIVGVNPGKYNASNPNWGVFPPINLVYTGPTSPYNGFGVSDNAYAIVEIADNAFNHSANQCPFTEGPLNLTSNIVRIGANAFNSVKITGVLTIPSSVTYIGNQAFSNLLIDETVFENETNSDLLGGVVDSTRVSSQNKSARMAADTVLNTLKVAKANPTMTGVTTISNAAISNAAIVNASVNIANVTTATLVSASIANMGVGGAASFSGTVSAAGQWNYTVQPKYNGMGLATQSYVDSKISIMNGTEALTSTLNTLNKIASAIGEDPNYGLHVSQSQSTIAQSTVIETLLRSSQITSLSSALSSATQSLQTVDASVASGIVSGSTVRSSQIASLSSALSSATLSLQTVDTTLLSTNVSNTAARSSQITSLSSALSTFASDRQANDIAMTSGIASLVFRRNIDVASVSTALSSGVSSLQSTDVSLSSAIVSASAERTNAVSSISAILSSAVPSLHTADTAFLNALGSRTSDRVAAMTSLSNATTSHVSALQAVKSTILPQISGGSLSQDGTTSTVFNLLSVNVGNSLTFLRSGGSGTFSTNDKITIMYSATDYLKGTVTNVVGSNVTFTVTFKTTSAVETQIYSTTGPSGHTNWLDAGNYIAPLSSPSFIASSNYVITTMSTQVYAYIYSANGALFNMNLLNDSNVTLATSNNLSYSTTEMEYLCAFNTAFVPQNSTIKQQLVFNKYIKIRVSFNVSGAAHTTIKGYAVPYSSGVVQIEVPGTAQSARISAMASLSGGVASMLLSQSTVNTSISSAIFNASSARSSAITALSIDKSASVSSLQSVSRALSSTQSTAVSDRISNVASLSNALYGNVSSLTSVNASNSTQLSIGIGNRSAQIINAVNSLVNGAPSALDTLFEIANALTTGPSMYTTISNTDTSITSNTGARSSQIASLSSALSSATLSLHTVDTALLSTHASNTGARSSQIASLSSALSSATLSLHTVDTALLSTHASNTAARSSHIESLSNSIVGLVSTQVSFSGSISSANSAETSTLILNVSSLSSLLSTLVTTLSGADTSLSNAFTSLSNSTQLSTLANLTEVDASVAGIMGLSTIVALDTLGKIASAINLQPDIGTVLTSMTNAKGDVSSVSSISTAATSKTTQFSLSQLTDAVSLKVSVSTTTSLQSVISGLTTSFGVLQTDVASLMSSTAVNSIVTADIVKTTRDLDELYVKNGFVNPDGSINYKINHLANPVINPGSSSTLTFAIDGNHQLTGIRQVAAVRFDSLQTTMKYTNRGTEFTVSSSAFTNRVYTFSIESSSIADYNNNATEIVVTGQETALRLAPLSSLTIPKLALSNYTYAAPTVQTPYAATTWNDTTGKISQVLRFNFESDVQKIHVDDSNGSIHNVAGTTEKVVTLEYYPGASGTVIVYALNSASKLRSPSLMLSNVYNDYPQYAAPVLVGGTNAISLSGSTCTYSATFSSDANVVEVHAYDAGTSTYSKVQDLTPATGNQFSVSRTYDVSRIGQPLFKLKSATSASKRASDFSTVVNCDPFTFPLPVISSNLSYTNLNTDPKSFSVNATYAVHPLATVVQVINSGTGGTLMSPNPTVSNGSVAITFNFTEAQALAGMSFYVKINTNSVGLESSSVAQALKSQYDAPVIVAGTKTITLSGSTYTHTANYTSASTTGINVYDSTGSTLLHTVTTPGSGTFTVTATYDASKIGQPAFKLSSNSTSAMRESALITVSGEDIPQFSIPVLQTSASYVKNGSVYTASMTYVISGTTQVSAVRILNASDGITSVTNATTQSVSASGGNVVALITVDFTTPLSIVVVAEANAYGKQSIASTHHALTGEHDAPAIVAGTKTITLSGSTYTHTANYTSASTTGIKVYDSAGTTLLQTVTTPGSGTFTVVQTYDASKIGQPAFKLSSKATTEMRESALITVSGEDIPAHVAPVMSGGITYGTSGSDQTAQMNYTVSSRVDTVNVLKSDGSALPAGASFIVSTTGTSRVITVTFPNSIAPVTVAVFAELNAYGKRSLASASQTLLGLHAAPVIVAGTKVITQPSATELSYTAQFTSASSDGLIVYDADGVTHIANSTGSSSPFSLSLSYNISKVGSVVFKVASKATAAMRESALVNIVAEDITTHPAPLASGGITYGTSGSDHTAQLDYTAHYRVDNLTVLKSDLTPLPSGASFTQSILSTVGTTRTFRVMVTYSNTVAPLTIAVVGLTNAYGKQSAASASQSLLVPYAAPTISKTITLSGNTYTHNATYTSVSAAGVNVYNAVKTWNLTRTSNMLGSFNFTPTDNPSNVAFHIDFRSDRVVFGYYNGSWPVLNTVYDLHNLSLPTAFTVSFNPVSGFTLTYGPSNTVVTFPNYLNIATLAGVSDTVKSNWYDGPHFVIGTADLMPMGTSLNPQSGSSPFTITSKYDVSQIGQTLSKVSSKGDSTNRESALVSVLCEDIPIHANPVISGGITHGISGSDQTAQMNYTVSSVVDTVKVLKPDGSALPAGASFTQTIVSTTGTSRVISVIVTFTNSIAPVTVAVFAELNAYGKRSLASASQTLLGLHAAPVIVAGTKAVSSSIQMFPVYTTGIINTNNSFIPSNVSMTNSANYPVMLSVTFNLSSFASSGGCIIGKYLLGGSSDYFIYWDITPFGNGVGVVFRMATGNGTQTTNTNISGDTLLNGVDYTLSMKRTNDTSLTFKIVNATTNAVVCADQTYTFSSTRLNNYLITDAGLSIGYANSVYAEIYYSVLQLVGYVKNVKIEKNMQVLNYTANYTSASTAGIKVYDSAGTTLLQTVTTPGSGTFTVVQTYDASKIGQTAFRLSSNSTSAMRESALITVSGEDIQVHNSPTRAGGAIYGTSGSNYTAQLEYSSSYSAPRSVDELIVLKADGSALPSGASYTQSILNTVTFTGSDVTRFFRVIVTFTDAVSPLNIIVESAANMYGKQSTEGTPYMLISPYDAPVIVAGTKTITLSGSTYTYTANYTSASTAGIKVYDSAGTTLLQTVTTPGSGTFTVTATYDASKIGQTVFVLKSAASATRSESVSALTVVGEDIPAHVAPIIVADSLAINSTIPSIYATTSSMSFPSRTYVSNTATVLQNFPTIIGDTWSGWDIHVFFTPTGGGSSIRPIVGSYSYNTDGSGSDWRIYIAANNYIYWAWSGEEMLIGESIGEITLNHSYYFRARKLNNSFYYEFTLVNITTNVMAFNQRTSYDPTFSPTVRVGTGNPVTVGQWKYNANQMFIGTISSVQVGSYTATMSYTVNYLVDALNILKSDGSALPANVTVQQSVVSTIGTSRVISVALGFLDLTAPSSIAAFAAANVYGKKSAASTTQTLLGMHAAPVLSGTVAYSGTGPHSASMTYTVASGVTAVSVLKSDLTALPAGASVTTNTVSGTTATLVVSFTDAVAPLGIVVVALANSAARQSPASASHTLLGLPAAPVLSGTVAYSGTGTYSASMTYIVASDVTAVSVLKSDLNALPAGASVTTNTVSGTTATLVVSFTNAVAPLGIVVVALNSAGRQSPASASQTLLGLHSAPVLSGTVAYSGTGPYSASMTYTIASGVTAVSVLKSDLNALPAGASVTTNTVSGTTATLVVSFTDAVAPLGIVVVALANSVARQSPASASQTLSVPVPPPAIARAGTVSSGTLGTLSTFGASGAGNGQFAYPFGIATDAAGNIYVTDHDNNRIQKFSSAGAHIITFGSQGTGNGQFNLPNGIAIDATGNIYVADSENHRIQKFSSAGAHIITFGSQGTGNGQFNIPLGIAIDASGKILVADAFNNRIQIFTSAGGHIRTIGTGTVGNANGQFNYPSGIAVNATGNIYVVDTNNYRIQIFTSDGTHVSSFGIQLNSGIGIAIDASGKIVVPDTGNSRIQVFTSAGTHVSSFGSQGTGNGQFKYPRGLAIDASGKIIVADTNNHRIHIVGPPPLPPAIQRAGTLPSGTLSTLSTFGSQGAGNGQFNIPYRIALDASGKIYVVDTNNHRIQIFNSAGTYVSKIGGVQGSGSGHFNYPYGIAIDASGKILVADSDNHRIQVFNSDGTYVSTIGSQGTANGRFNNPTGIAIDASGKILVADAFNHRIQIFTNAGIHVSTIGTGIAGNANGQFNYPKSIAIDASGKILVADSDNHRIQVFNSDGTYDTQFGTYGTTDNGNFRFPSEIAIDASGKILVADGSNHRIQLFTSAGIHVSTIGSQGTGNGQFQYPRGFAIDASGKILVADTHNHRVQIVGQ